MTDRCRSAGRAAVRGFVAIVLMAAILIIPGCGSDKRQGRPSSPPRAYHPERFPDIPLPADFVIDERHDQLAMVMAGGLVRRFEVWMIEKEKAKSQSPAEVLGWYERVLPAQGWQRVPGGDRTRSWRKQAPEGAGEVLSVTAGGAMRTTVRFQLRPGT